VNKFVKAPVIAFIVFEIKPVTEAFDRSNAPDTVVVPFNATLVSPSIVLLEITPFTFEVILFVVEEKVKKFVVPDASSVATLTSAAVPEALPINIFPLVKAVIPPPDCMLTVTTPAVLLAVTPAPTKLKRKTLFVRDVPSSSAPSTATKQLTSSGPQG
jgi:hypothetical protein